MTPRSRKLLPLLLIPLLACDDPSGPDGTVALGTIAPPEPGLAVTVDGDDIVIDFMTYGSSCMSKHHDDVDVSQSQQTVVIRPYDFRPDGACPDDYAAIPHRVRVDTDANGSWVVRVTGRAFTMPPGDDELTIEAEVVVGGTVVDVPIDSPSD